MEPRFFDRVGELKSLEERHDRAGSGSGSLVAIYGRRRVGKTELVRRFLDRIPSKKLYFYVDLTERRVLLDSLQKAISEQLENVVFVDFDDFFAFVGAIAEKTVFVVVIDEFQRLLSVRPGGHNVPAEALGH